MRRTISCERGNATVELAFVIPLIVVVLVGLLSTLWLVTARSALTGAARDGARYASIRHDPLECAARPCSRAYPSEEQVAAFVRERAGGFDAGTVTAVRPAGPNDVVSVTVRAPLPLLLRTLGGLFGGDELVFESEAKVRAE